jgi:glycosyltransferase involved in cell wall biosynthesis
VARFAYISFDQVPAPKGASTHIEAFVRGLAAEFSGVDLVTVSSSSGPEGPFERWPGVMHWELPALGVSLIDRVLYFRGFLTRWLEARRYDVIHVRSIFEGIPVARRKNGAALVFEVNGLPSIELKYRYPGAEDDRELMRKIEAQERECVGAADRILTPSAVTRNFLVASRGAIAQKISVIPNGADTELFRPPGSGHPGDQWKLLYFGTLSAWQGVDLGIRAVAKVDGTTLTILGTGSRSRFRGLEGLARKLGVGDRVALRSAVSQAELAEELSRCDAVLAPLPWNDRNSIQGCCPLKVLEGMASGQPVITSDLEVVRELAVDEQHLLLTRPGSVDSMAGAIRRLRGDPVLAAKLGSNGRRLVEERYTWSHAVESLTAVYRELINRPELMTRLAPTSRLQGGPARDRN